MNYWKFILCILFFGLMPAKTEAHNEFHSLPGDIVIEQRFFADEVLQPDYCENDNHFKEFHPAKKKLKARNLSVDKNGIGTGYASQIHYAGVYYIGLNYGVATSFFIPLNTHLHLYQLF